ncbi:MAG: hypothetical protein WDA03_06575 [Trueperaceae bacterium]
MSDGPSVTLAGFDIRTGMSHDELSEIEQIQREVWGPDDIVPAPHLRAVEHSGGQVAAAFREGRMIGFSYGFLAAPHGAGMVGSGLHSHMVAVRSEGRGLGVGQALKWQQRDWALRNGLTWISWTFDPLQARNARLNLEHLGALAFDYLVDFYGAMPGPLGGGQSSDRLLAVWQLNSARVRRLRPRWALALDSAAQDSEGRPVAVQAQAAPRVGAAAPAGPDQSSDFWAVRPSSGDPDAEPLLAASDHMPETARVAVPPDVTRLLSENPDLARRWRGAVGAAMSRLLQQGYVAVGFGGGGYVMKHGFEE